MLVLVVGRNVGGNQAWISLGGGFRLQPSEFAKFTTCLLLARYLSGTNVRVAELRSFIIAAAIIGVPMLLILMQPDVGSTLVFYSLIFVLYREGLSPYFLVISALFIVLFLTSILYNPLYVIAVISILTLLIVLLFKKNRRLTVTVLTGLSICIVFVFSVKFIYNRVLQPHQKVRIDIVLGIKTDLKGKGYNVNQSKIAIGSGKLWGKGYLNGTQTKYSFVPAQSTDFIFCTVGEEWGFAGSTVVLGLYLFLILRINSYRRKATIAIFPDLWIWRNCGYIFPCVYKYCHNYRFGAGNRYSPAVYQLRRGITAEFYISGFCAA